MLWIYCMEEYPASLYNLGYFRKVLSAAHSLTFNGVNNRFG